jgi:hypothetical protein
MMMMIYFLPKPAGARANLNSSEHCHDCPAVQGGVELEVIPAELSSQAGQSLLSNLNRPAGFGRRRLRPTGGKLPQLEPVLVNYRSSVPFSIVEVTDSERLPKV